MEKPKTTAKDFFLWAGAMVAFYWSVIAYTFLVFDYINYVYPNVLANYWIDPYQSGISYEMASIIVLLPVYLLLMWLIHKDAARDPSRSEIWVRRWALILTLFVAGVTIAVDLIVLLTTFLSGEALTLAFMLKVIVILLIAAGVFMHFIADLKGYWDANPTYRNFVRIGVGLLAVVTIGAGFLIVGTPAEARLARFDAQKVSDLQNIQQQIGSYYQAKQKLPVATADLASLPYYSYSQVPVDPQTGVAYEYQATGKLTYTLCTSFNAESTPNQLKNSQISEPVGYPVDSWKHSSGRVCFERVIDPAFYPPLK
jgi:hypothetical protein